ncbi:uncharacterized protein LOC123556597 isoform X2 [Mercenaria mercenaria]|uniref:uncharacterized protein LOC123556597 isoform X2 n=1 Tax=Mercenaria mercenaria TaxID=6596 RepID=UPI00234EA4A4|nr:uncharacterized protein LOC123556597 isoform X2 [Mercenaria mercenaria]
MFCLYFKLCFLPVSTITLQLYAQFLSRSFRSVDSIKNYISGIKTMHQMLGCETDYINNFLLNLSLKGIAKLKQHSVKQAEAITPVILQNIYLVLDFSKADNITYWCLFLFAFFLMARKSNLVPTVKKDLMNPKFLLRKDVEVLNNELLVSMHWTKTIQAGERILRTPLSSISDSCLCPVTAFRNMVKVFPAGDNAPLFILTSGKVVTYQLFQTNLRSCIRKIGLNPAEFSTHSFRRGFATLAFQMEIPPDHIQLLGDWRSDAYKRLFLSYLRRY